MLVFVMRTGIIMVLLALLPVPLFRSFIKIAEIELAREMSSFPSGDWVVNVVFSNLGENHS
jgi:hypothetical protein